MSVDVTWVGHATVRFDIDGTSVITDPLLTGRVAHLRRRVPVPAELTADVDLVLISHAHMDHLHVRSLKRIHEARVIAPRGLGVLLGSLDLDVIEVDIGDTFEHGSVRVEVVPAAHKRGRGPHTRAAADPVGFVIEGEGTRHYFPGDTDVFDGMGELGNIDVAMIPIWGWGSTLGEGHLDPVRAIDAIKLIDPRVVVPMHWGTYSPENGRRGAPTWFRDPLDRFERGVAVSGDASRVHRLEPGETLHYVQSPFPATPDQ